MRRYRKPSTLRTPNLFSLTTAASFLHLFLLVLVEDLEVGAPADEFLGGHGGADFGQAHAQFFGDAKLEHEPVVFPKFRA